MSKKPAEKTNQPILHGEVLPTGVKRKRITDYQYDPANLNEHTERGMRALDDSVTKYGLGRSIVTDKNGIILAGNATHETAVSNGFQDVIEVETTGNELVVVRRTDLDLTNDEEHRARMLAIGDNRVGQLNLSIDDSALLEMMQEQDLDLSDFYTPVELEEMKRAELSLESGNGGTDGADATATPEIDQGEVLLEKWDCKPGDVWRIKSLGAKGEHIIVCGDVRDPATVKTAANGGVFRSALTSPPYAEQRSAEYPSVPADGYVDWWESVQANVGSALAENGCFFINIKAHGEDGEMALYVMDLVLAMKRRWGWAFIEEFCWQRTEVPQQPRWRFKNGFEPVYQFAKQPMKYVFHPESVMIESKLVPTKKNADDKAGSSWSGMQGNETWLFGEQQYGEGLAYPSNVLKASSNDKARGHPAAYAMDMCSFFIKAYSDPNERWLDPFLGSATTMAACEREGRLCSGVELVPKYVAICLERMELLGLEVYRG